MPKRLINCLGLAVMIAMAPSSLMAQSDKTQMRVGIGPDPTMAQMMIADSEGFFEKHGLDVELLMGASSAVWVPLLIGNEVQATMGTEQTGLVNHALASKISSLGQNVIIDRFFGAVARNVNSLEDLKGKRIGVDSRSNSIFFWNRSVDVLGLDPDDYEIINLEPPEMPAALQRGDIDAFVAWEPWLTKSVSDIPGTKLLIENDGIMPVSDYVYMNREWAEANEDAATAFMAALVDATEYINTNRDEAVDEVSKQLRLDRSLTATLMDKVVFKISYTPEAVEQLKSVANHLKESKRLANPIDWDAFIYTTPLRKAHPDKVTIE